MALGVNALLWGVFFYAKRPVVVIEQGKSRSEVIRKNQCFVVF